MSEQINRRSFVKRAGVATAGASALARDVQTRAALEQPVPSFQSTWTADVDRPWVGADYWTNPLQDWRVRAEHLECHSAGGDRNVALLTRSVADRAGDLQLSVRFGPLDTATREQGFVGFRVGVKHQFEDYRAAAIYGQGLNAGVNADGRLFIGSLEPAAPRVNLAGEVRLRLEATALESGYSLSLRADGPSQSATVEIKRDVPSDWLTGGVALVCSSAPVEQTPRPLSPIKDFSFYPPNQQRGGTMRFWFADWTVGGSKVDRHDDRAYGPILFTLYTLSKGTLKLSAQFPPLGNSPRTAMLQILEGGAWKPLATADIDPDAWNAVFRAPSWDVTRDCQYRVVYAIQDASVEKQYSYSGTIRRDPVDKPDLTIGLLTCIWDFGFPHNDFVRHLGHHRPDILFWTGDQIYEPVAGFGVIESRAPDMLEPAMVDFLRKWFLFGWSVRELTRDIPSICMTDDHDMFHGNIWGCGGRPTNPALSIDPAQTNTVRYGQYAAQDSGGYKMPPRWVNMVQRAQTAHLPDPFDPTPVLQSIGVYYTSLRWGGVSFAILEDRKWKSAPKQHLPDAKIVNGFAMNPHWDAASQSDVPTAELLGQRQLNFLEAWADDWSGGTWMKFAVSQTPFGCLHTEPAGVNADDHDPEEAIPEVGIYIEGDHMVADHDSAGWPQHGRNAAILKWRKGFAAHLCGDQHLGTTSHYGVTEFRDGVYSICTPAISNIWPRRWYPPEAGNDALAGKRYTGDYKDAFGNHLSVFAAANPARYPGSGLDGLRFRVTGYTILKCNRATRRTTVAAWPRWVDPSAEGAKPYDGWPIVIEQLDNCLCGAQWALQTIETTFRDPVVQVQKLDGDVVYTLRINGRSFTPTVREPGVYKLIAYDPDGDSRQEWTGLQAQRKKIKAQSS